MTEVPELNVGQTLTGPLFNEPMRIETISRTGAELWVVGVVGVQSERFRRVTLSKGDLISLTILGSALSFDGDGNLLRLGIQAYALGIAYEFDPYFALSISKVDPLPHQLEAVYDFLLKLARVKFLLADDAGAGKTIRAGLRQVHWDLVIVDEAHRMSWTPPSRKTSRYALGELLWDTSDHMLLLTATPHKGDPANFSLFLQLLDQDAYADVRSIREAMERRCGPFYLRRTKEAMVYFPERGSDGEWVARKIFTKRIPHTVDFQTDGPEFDLPDVDELEEMDEADRERIERLAEAISLTQNADEVRREMDELRSLAAQALTVEEAGVEAKLSRLEALLREQGFFDDSDQRLLIFTEFEDTLDYLIANLTEWGFRVGCIHGGMKPGSRDEPGTRLYVEQQFREGAIQILAATEAAGEGINLQVCHILFNYDIPWNPNRLEQRMGRIHRYGQRRDCLIFNFVATNTIEGRVLQRLLEKLQEIRNALEGLASKKLNLDMLIERRARAQERRVVPESIARFLGDASGCANLILKPVTALEHTFDPGKTPGVLRRCEHDPDWRLPTLANKYPRLSTHRETAEEHNLEWVTPGHSLFEALRRHIYRTAQEDLKQGACLYSLAHESPVRIDVYRARVVDGLGQTIHQRMFAVELSDGAEPCMREPSLLGNFIPLQPSPCGRGQGEGALGSPANATLPTPPSPHPPLPPELKQFARPLRQSHSDAEKSVWSLLRDRRLQGWKFRRQHPVDPYILDFYCHQARLAVELDGGQHNTETGRRHDRTRADFLARKGIRVIRFWNHEVLQDSEAVLEAIWNALSVNAPSPPAPLPKGEGSKKPSPAGRGQGEHLPSVAHLPEATAWLQQHALQPFLEELRQERQAEIERISRHVELSLTELLARADEEVGRAYEEVDRKTQGAEGRLSQAENRHAELLARRERRRQELQQQRSLTLQSADRLTSVLVLPHPDRETPEVRRLRPNRETEAVAMQVVMEHERSLGRLVYDVSQKNLGYDVTSLDLSSGEWRLIEVKGIGAATGTVMLTPNELRVAQDRRDCYWLYVVTDCANQPVLQEPIRDPARLPWHEVSKVQHYWLEVNAMTEPMTVREDADEYGWN